MYFVVETNYVGPNKNQAQYIDGDTIEIRTSPAITNSGNEARTDGWCGTTNNWAVYAHGAYDTIERARLAILEKFGEVRVCDPNGKIFQSDDEDVAEVCKRGKYTPLGSQDTAEWAFEAIHADIEADTTDSSCHGPRRC